MNAFYALLDALAAAPVDERLSIEQQIRDTFQRRKAVLALDMSGFTLTVRREGILSYLCQIRRMQALTKPIVLAHQGELVKFSADNLLAVFDVPGRAVEAALAMVQATASEAVVDSAALSFSVGIDYGEVVLVSGVDCFGDPVNLAYKLGEDIARPGEVLVTEQVLEQLPPGSGFGVRQIPLSLSGLEVITYSLVYGNS